jgi:MFS family permease
LVQARKLTRFAGRPGGVFYGWWLAVTAALVMVIGTVPMFQGMPIWFVVLERGFHWNSAQLSLAFSLSRVEGSIMGPIAGYLIDRVGPRRMVLIGMSVLGIGFVAFSRVNSLWQFYLVFIVMSSGTGLGTWLPMMTVLNNWFIRRRSIAMGIAMVGFAMGGVLLVPALAWSVDPDRFGLNAWRNSALLTGAVIILVAYPISRMVRDRPEDYGQIPDGDLREPASPPGDESGAGAADFDYTWQQAIRTKAFWLISMGHACSSIVIVTLMVHLGTLLTDRGFSLQTVAWVVAAQTGVSAVFNLVGGYVGDRIPMRLALFGFSAIQSGALILLLMIQSPAMAFLFAVVFGVGFGGRTPLTTSIRGLYFGRRAFASITGISMIPMNVFLLVSPLFAGIMFEATGSYDIPFTVVAVVSFMGAVMFLFLGKPKPSLEKG